LAAIASGTPVAIIRVKPICRAPKASKISATCASRVAPEKISRSGGCIFRPVE
jgi:hypothetical protein